MEYASSKDKVMVVALSDYMNWCLDLSPSDKALTNLCCHRHLGERGAIGAVSGTVPSAEILHKCDVHKKFSNPTQNTLGENESAYVGQGPCLVLLELPPRKTENQGGSANSVAVSTSF